MAQFMKALAHSPFSQMRFQTTPLRRLGTFCTEFDVNTALSIHCTNTANTANTLPIDHTTLQKLHIHSQRYRVDTAHTWPIHCTDTEIHCASTTQTVHMKPIPVRRTVMHCAYHVHTLCMHSLHSLQCTHAGSSHSYVRTLYMHCSQHAQTERRILCTYPSFFESFSTSRFFYSFTIFPTAFSSKQTKRFKR